jgi:hypothetical protein
LGRDLRALTLQEHYSLALQARVHHAQKSTLALPTSKCTFLPKSYKPFSIMQSTDKLDFIRKFFHFTSPLPLRTTFTEEDLKNNDMKITL